jgi:hypothetical protein
LVETLDTRRSAIDHLDVADPAPFKPAELAF